MNFSLPALKRKLIPPTEGLISIRARLFDERQKKFANVRNSRILIYWPHGFGDFVHLGYLLPLLEPSNQYWIARYGDDFSALYKDNPDFPMLPSGIKETSNVFGSSARDYHLGVRFGSAKGTLEKLSMLPALAENMRRFEIDTVLWTDYPEPNGKQAFPFHSKIRSLAKLLIAPEKLNQLDLYRRLKHAALFKGDREATSLVAQRMRSVFGERDFSELCLIQSGGHSAPRKNWDETNVRNFTNAFLADSRGKRAVVLLNNEPWAANESKNRDAAVFTWSDLFPAGSALLSKEGNCIEYARLICAVMRKAALVVGVPAGPMHLALAMGSVPTIGLWRAHHPAAYEEPNLLARHIVSRSVMQAKSAQWRISRTLPADFGDPIIELETDEIAATRVYEVAQELLQSVSDLSLWNARGSGA